MARSLRVALATRVRPLVVAHRGDSGSCPENTMLAFEAAVAGGADLIELDFHATADGVLVCLHDATLARTGGGDSRRIAEVQCAELAEIDVGSWKHARFSGARISTLESVLQTIAPRAFIAAEHKAGDAATFVELVTRLGWTESVLAQSFDWDWLREVQALEPRIPLAALGGEDDRPTVTPAILDELADLEVVAVNWDHTRLGDADVALLHQRGYRVLIYTADEISEYARLVRIGVDAITTNEPRRLIAYLASAAPGSGTT